jgi:hypothetical protein
MNPDIADLLVEMSDHIEGMREQTTTTDLEWDALTSMLTELDWKLRQAVEA